MSLQNLQPRSAVLWEPELALLPATPEPALLSWLTDTGLLTPRMRRLCPGRFRLDVLGEDVSAAADTLRRVLLCCGDSPCIYAETFVPATTRAAHPWLCSLGGEPLGEALQFRSDVRRDGFEYALFSPAQLPAQIALADSTWLWARRSVFTLGQSSLTVTEVFLPGVIECEQRSARAGHNN